MLPDHGRLCSSTGSFSSDAHVPLSRGWLARTALGGLGIALAVSTKWTGASTLGVAGLHSILALVRSFVRLQGEGRLAVARALVAEALARLALLVLLPLLVYVGSFALHFRLLPRTGAGAKFMTSTFRASLDGDSVGAPLLQGDGFTELSFWAKFGEVCNATPNLEPSS